MEASLPSRPFGRKQSKERHAPARTPKKAGSVGCGRRAYKNTVRIKTRPTRSNNGIMIKRP